MDLHYNIQGQGSSIVLLHSGGADLRDWEFIAPKLAQTHQVIAFDGRGAGQSPPLIEPADYVEDLRALLDALAVDSAVLVGHSIGGQIATDFALAYPERVSRLILIAPGLSGFQMSPEMQQWYAHVLAAAPDVEKMVQLMLDHPVYGVTMASPHRDHMVQMTLHNTRRWSEWKTSEMLWAQPPAIERLGTLKPKTLFIIGTQDSDDNLRIAEAFKLVPNVRFADIDGADHMPTLTHSEEVTRLITDWLSE